ncbi:hypothetical protein IV203_029996 [Nitzschia inconspicua]|uniref:Uncharacterized protein n=1 Tax=Nitzschia inconspicua TaxID=303405 RepID=A0A9K3LRR6_9STRA|nr:hypothetical protein IV203_029996 [Nitzschia inconspicua]
MSTNNDLTFGFLTEQFRGCDKDNLVATTVSSSILPPSHLNTRHSCNCQTSASPLQPAQKGMITTATRRRYREDATKEPVDFKEDEVLHRFKVIRHDIGDKVIRMTEDVFVTCDNWRDPKSNVLTLGGCISDPQKKHLVFYDMWHEDIVVEILSLLRRKSQNRCWKLIEFRGCQERHINAVLETVLKMDIVQTIAFSLTNEKYDPMRRCKNSSLDVIARSMENNKRLECLIFHSRPIHFIQAESLKNLRIKRLHFLENVNLHPNEIPELAVGLKANTSLQSFSFLGGVTHISECNDVSKIVNALKGHPSLERLSLCLKSTTGNGVSGLDELLSYPNSPLACVTLSGGFTENSFFVEGALSRGLHKSNLKHLYLKDTFLFPRDIDDLASGLRLNRSLESFSMKLDASDCCVDVSKIAFALEDNHRIQRLSLSGQCNLGEGVQGVANLLASENSQLRDLHLSGAFLDKSARAPEFLEIFTQGLKGNNKIESLDLSVNDLSDDEVQLIYKQVGTCSRLTNLDLGMNDVSRSTIEAFSHYETPNRLSVLRVSSSKFSFFHIDDELCRSILKILSINSHLGDINFNMGPVEWHQTYYKGKMQWHHFFPAYRVYSLHSNNKRVEYLKNKELNSQGKRDLERIQYQLDYNWAGRSLVEKKNKMPVALWPRALERVWEGRICFWTGREQGSSLEYSHDVTYSFLRDHLSTFLKTGEPSRGIKRPQNTLASNKKQKC